MKLSTTMTALALATMTLAGCSTMSETSEPVATAPAEPAPVAAAPADTMEAQETMAAGDAMMEKDDTMMMKDDSMTMEAEPMMAKDDAMMMEEETMEEEVASADDAAISACFAAGGQVVSWIGDPSGAEQACRREDGLEYRLADAQYYQ